MQRCKCVPIQPGLILFEHERQAGEVHADLVPELLVAVRDSVLADLRPSFWSPRALRKLAGGRTLTFWPNISPHFGNVWLLFGCISEFVFAIK